MGFYHVAQICLNGHIINDSSDKYPESNENFCSKCGAKAITTCPACGNHIRGDYDVGMVFISTSKKHAPSYCHNCGKPYPWTESAIETARVLIAEDEALSELERNNLSESLPDIIAETPKTQLAVVRMKKALAIAGKFTADALRQFVIDFGSEVALRQLNLK